MKVLFVGGTGTISSACTELAIKSGINITILNRGKTTYRSIPSQVNILTGDIRNSSEINDLLSGQSFDVVVDWVAYTPDQIENDFNLFINKVGQYIFISSASAYQTPPSQLPVTESTILDNPYWQYSRDKIKCEEFLTRMYQDNKFPMTIVRPSHTYDHTRLPIHGRFTEVDRMRKGKKVIVHGDGSSLWTITHAKDFAKGLVGLLGNSHAIGETVHITSDQSLTWNQIYLEIAHAAGVLNPSLIHVPSDVIAQFDRDWGISLLGDKTNSMIFDNTKIKRLVPGFSANIPFSVGIKEVMQWYDEDSTRQIIDENFNKLSDMIIGKMDAVTP